MEHCVTQGIVAGPTETVLLPMQSRNYFGALLNLNPTKAVLNRLALKGKIQKSNQENHPRIDVPFIDFSVGSVCRCLVVPVDKTVDERKGYQFGSLK